MAAEENEPLLNDPIENCEILENGEELRSLFEDDKVLKCLSKNKLIHNKASISSSGIVCVFVVAFDTKAGNIIEWQEPNDIDLKGIEFKALCSGAHTLKTDFVYFRHGNFFGLACFEKLSVSNELERGARMKSVGILSANYNSLYEHLPFLTEQVSFALTLPSSYDALEKFYHERKCVIENEEINGLAIEVVSHPSNCVEMFIKFFAEKLFVIWKFALLQKRILFFSPPPIGDVCYRVYCTCWLANYNLNYQLSTIESKPHFFVNVADIDSLQSEISYVACTTEKIFELKSELYDLYVDNQNIRTSSHSLSDIAKPTPADTMRLNQLYEARNGLIDENQSEMDIFTNFFTKCNNKILHTLLNLANSEEKSITADHITSMGLHPQGDRSFLMELIETYGVDVVLIADNPCCPT